MLVEVADQRILAGRDATLRWTNTDADGIEAVAAGTVTVAVARADGTSLTTGTATLDGTTTGTYTFALTAAQTATLDRLTVTWTDGGDSSTATTTVEIVGGYLVSIAEARAYDNSLSVDRISDTDLVTARYEAEIEVEWICARAFVPRYGRFTLDGADEPDLVIPATEVRTITACTVDGSAYGSSQLAALVPVDSGTGETSIIQQPWGSVWNTGQANVTVAVAHGWTNPPPDLKRAFKRRLRDIVNGGGSGIPERATRFQVTEGGTFELNTPNQYSTGIPDVDATYQRWSRRSSGGEARPASGQVDFDPQYFSLFHGGHA